MKKKFAAEFFGTFWLVFGGCGAAVLAGDHIGWHGVALAFGLTVLTMAYAIGHISGCHLNPSITIGLTVAGRFKAAEAVPYIVAQCFGATAAAAVLYCIVKGGTGDIGTFAANGYGEHSPGHYSMAAAFITEFVLSFAFLLVIMGATDARNPVNFAPIAIGLCLTLIHLIGIPVTNTSVNPARSLSQALFVQGWALAQLWLFFAAPIAGGICGATLYNFIRPKDSQAAEKQQKHF